MQPIDDTLKGSGRHEERLLDGLYATPDRPTRWKSVHGNLKELMKRSKI